MRHHTHETESMKESKNNIIFAIVAFLVMMTTPSMAGRRDSLLLKKLFSYASTIDTSKIQPTSYVYERCETNVKRRNFLLLAVPTMFAVAHSGRRNYLSETYGAVNTNNYPHIQYEKLAKVSTFPHLKELGPEIIEYLIPRIYNVTICENRLLSPFYEHNSGYYRYRVTKKEGTFVTLRFKPKTGNTQLVAGSAVIDENTGQIQSALIYGEYDMIRFSMDIKMNTNGEQSLLPKKVLFKAAFKLAGNHVESVNTMLIGLNRHPEGNVTNNNLRMMEQLRPDTLSLRESAIYDSYFNVKDSTENKEKKKSKDSFAKRILWDIIADNVFNKIRGRFGPNSSGYFKINPIFNPLYLGYSHSKGLVYKQDVRATYTFSENAQLSMRIKAGYSFKQKLIYYTFPTTFFFNNKHDGYIQFEFGNGNRITNSKIAEDIKEEKRDSIDWSKFNLDYFKDSRTTLTLHYNLNTKIGFQIGVIHHTRTAVDKVGFDKIGKQSVYKSFAPMFEIEYRPAGFAGPIFTCDYEHSLNGVMGSNMKYSRWEFDGQYILNLQRLKNLSLRAGCGFYTSHSKNYYFLDYSNFRENNLPGGWNDDWSGEFELLNSNWYNASNYYVRANVTYESPLLLLSWIPLLGHFIETERIYASSLAVKKLSPYTEIGYGLTTRLFSMGMFVSNKNGKFDGFGCKFGFELFRDW